MLKAKTCKVEGCSNPVWSKGKCKNHLDKKPKGLKATSLKARKKVSSDKKDSTRLLDFFNEIWDSMEKPRVCQSCGKIIYSKENSTLYHHHVLAKSKYPQFKYDKRNILFLCPECHEEVENAKANDRTKELIYKIKKELLNGQ